MALICLIGRHGSGKSTVGSDLVQYGYKHISVGLLRRLAMANQYPMDVPAVLISAMRRERAGAHLSNSTALKLVNFACGNENTVVDGFPASLDHLSLLPTETIFCVLWTPAQQRLERLTERGMQTKRLWTPGRPSAREVSLPEVIRKVRCGPRCIFLPNRGERRFLAADLMSKIVDF